MEEYRKPRLKKSDYRLEEVLLPYFFCITVLCLTCRLRVNAAVLRIRPERILPGAGHQHGRHRIRLCSFRLQVGEKEYVN